MKVSCVKENQVNLRTAEDYDHILVSGPASRFANRNNSVQMNAGGAGRLSRMCDSTTDQISTKTMRDRIIAAQNNKRRQSPSIAAAKFFPKDFFYNKAGQGGMAVQQQATIGDMQRDI